MRLRKLWPILLLGLLLSNCAGGPKVTVCLSNPKMMGMNCFSETTGQPSFLPYMDTNKFVCFNPTDAQTLLNFCGMQ